MTELSPTARCMRPGLGGPPPSGAACECGDGQCSLLAKLLAKLPAKLLAKLLATFAEMHVSLRCTFRCISSLSLPLPQRKSPPLVLKSAVCDRRFVKYVQAGNTHTAAAPHKSSVNPNQIPY